MHAVLAARVGQVIRVARKVCWLFRSVLKRYAKELNIELGVGPGGKPTNKYLPQSPPGPPPPSPSEIRAKAKREAYSSSPEAQALEEQRRRSRAAAASSDARSRTNTPAEKAKGPNGAEPAHGAGANAKMPETSTAAETLQAEPNKIQQTVPPAEVSVRTDEEALATKAPYTGSTPQAASNASDSADAPVAAPTAASTLAAERAAAATSPDGASGANPVPGSSSSGLEGADQPVRSSTDADRARVSDTDAGAQTLGAGPDQHASSDTRAMSAQEPDPVARKPEL